jgi:glycosyltransferase involved in cell wall biosynthesis
MKTIIYTGFFRLPIGDAGASRVLNNAKILRDLGHNVIFVSFGGNLQESDKDKDGNYYYEGFRYIVSNDIDIKAKTIFERVYNFFYSGKYALKIINEIKDNIDIIIGYNPTMYFANKILKICTINKIAYISDITEWHDANEFPGNRFAPPAWINDLNMYITQKKVKNKIIISTYLDEFYKNSNNIILPPLIDSNDVKWRDLKPVLPSFDGIRVIYAGTPAKKDLLETMLEGFISCLKKGLKLQFIVVGVSKDDISHYKNINDVFSYPENIILCGRVKQTEVPSYYNVSDFSIIIRESSRKNMAGFPTKLAETMMAGRPVILNYTSDISRFVQNGYNGFVMPNWSSNELEIVLSNIVTIERKEIEKLKSNALKSAYKNFNYLSYIEEMKDFIKKLA